MSSKIILVVIIGLVFSLLAQTYLGLINEFFGNGKEYNTMILRFFNEKVFFSTKYHYLYIFFSLILNVGVILNFYLKTKETKFLSLQKIILSSLISYLLAYLILCKLSYGTAYYSFFNDLIFYVLYIGMMKFVYKIERVFASFVVGSLILGISMLLSITIFEKASYIDFILFVCISIIFPIFTKSKTN